MLSTGISTFVSAIANCVLLHRGKQPIFPHFFSQRWTFDGMVLVSVPKAR